MAKEKLYLLLALQSTPSRLCRRCRDRTSVASASFASETSAPIESRSNLASFPSSIATPPSPSDLSISGATLASLLHLAGTSASNSCGQVDASFLQSHFPDSSLVGWFSFCRNSAMRPSMRELAVSVSLSKTLDLRGRSLLPSQRRTFSEKELKEIKSIKISRPVPIRSLLLSAFFSSVLQSPSPESNSNGDSTQRVKAARELVRSLSRRRSAPVGANPVTFGPIRVPSNPIHPRGASTHLSDLVVPILDPPVTSPHPFDPPDASPHSSDPPGTSPHSSNPFAPIPDPSDASIPAPPLFLTPPNPTNVLTQQPAVK